MRKLFQSIFQKNHRATAGSHQSSRFKKRMGFSGSNGICRLIVLVAAMASKAAGMMAMQTMGIRLSHAEKANLLKSPVTPVAARPKSTLIRPLDF
jgi:hypothetical protein